MNEENIVKLPEVTETTQEGSQAVSPETVKSEIPPKGFVPYQALDEERRKRKELEAKIKETPKFGDDDYSDEGRALRAEILGLKSELEDFKRLKEEEMILEKYPTLKDKASEFKDYLEDPENKGIPLEKVAKLFMAENSLTNEPVKRKGLEKPTSGNKTEVKKGWSSEDVRRLRETQPRKYEQMLRDGRINPDEIYD